MLRILVDLEVESFDEAELTLSYLAENVGKGYLSGEGWRVEGEEEDEEEDEEE
jgi:hypothetical protein